MAAKKSLPNTQSSKATSVAPAPDPIAAFRVAGDDAPGGQSAPLLTPTEDEASTLEAEQGNVVVAGDATKAPEEIRLPVKGGTITRHFVARKTVIAWGGQVLTLKPGEEITNATFGNDAVERMRASGVPMYEETKDE